MESPVNTCRKKAGSKGEEDFSKVGSSKAGQGLGKCYKALTSATISRVRLPPA